ncbi:MAG: hypothetical protein R3E77_01530 [Steroidobacteraceae bacterium]
MTRYIALLGLLLIQSAANAVPSFARQLGGVPCQTCHTAFPELNAYGRWFKLHGYTAAQPERKGLDNLPLALMAQLSITQTRHFGNDVADEFPHDGQVILQQGSAFVAGRINAHAGGFAQFTYDGIEHHTGLDLLDVRAVWNPKLNGHDLLLGITANNSPTMADAWNSLPVWGFPYAASSVAAGASASTLLDSGMQLAGLGMYAMLDNRWYGELGLYRNGEPGLARVFTLGNPVESLVDGNAPYLRVLWQHDSGAASYTVGGSALRADLQPDIGLTDGPTDRYTDIGLDSQLQYTLADSVLSAHTSYTHERQQRDASFAAGLSGTRTGSLNSFKLDVGYLLHHRYGATLGYSDIGGDADALLYADDAPVTGNLSNRPDTRWLTAEFDFLPLPNLKFSAQLTHFLRFNGAVSNYDGFGRSASDNDSLFVLGWLML